MLAIITSHPIQYQAPLWQALARDGRVPFEVWFLTPHALKPTVDREFGRSFAWDIDLLAGYAHRFLPVKANWNLDQFRGIELITDWESELRSRKVSVLWIEGWRFLTLWKAVKAARALGIPVWLRGESHDLAPESWSKTLIKRLALDWLFRDINKFLYIGSANRRFYRNHGINNSRLIPAPYCVDNDRFAQTAARLRPERSRLRAQWKIPENAYCLLFCGKLIPKKRPLDLVAAAKLAYGTLKQPLHLLFAGDGELRRQLEAELNTAPQVAYTLTGFLNQTEIPAAMIAADCMVLPSDYGETWGLVVNEALACGLPVIVSDHCGCAEDLAAPLGSGHVFPCGDTQALADSIIEVASVPPPVALIKQLSEAHALERTVESIAAYWPEVKHETVI